MFVHSYHLCALASISRRPGEDALHVFTVQEDAALVMEGHSLPSKGQPK